MEDVLTFGLVVYVIIGAAVYFLTDTTTLASRIESATPLPWELVESSVFAFVVALWPVWLVIIANVGGGKRARRP